VVLGVLYTGAICYSVRYSSARYVVPYTLVLVVVHDGFRVPGRLLDGVGVYASSPGYGTPRCTTCYPQSHPSLVKRRLSSSISTKTNTREFPTSYQMWCWLTNNCCSHWKCHDVRRLLNELIRPGMTMRKLYFA